MDETAVQGWPTALQCLTWSNDCQLAVGVGEHVAVFVPNSSPLDDEKKRFSEPLFHQILIRTNLFTTEEIPMRFPLEWRFWSVGDEIGQNTVAGIEWSQPGLAKHQNCALAVLTANCALSIWASDSDPKAVHSWKRVQLVNHALNNYFEQFKSLNQQDELQPEQSTRQRWQRIRSFAWSNHNRQRDQSNPPLGFPQLLAVSNECNEIVFIQIQSPYCPITHERTDWTARVIGHFSVKDHVTNEDPTTFEDYIRQQRYATSLSWIPFCGKITDKVGGLLSYITSSGLRVTVVTMTRENSDLSSTLKFSEINLNFDFDHIIPELSLWVPHTDGDSWTLLAFRQADILSFTFDSTFLCSSNTVRRNLDSCWDRVAGAALTSNASGSLVLNIAAHLDSAHAANSSLTLPLSTTEISASPSWQRQLRETANTFNDVHSLGGNVSLKAWGLASSPLGDLIAVASSCHPSNMVEYTIFADQRTILSFSESTRDGIHFILPPDGNRYHGRAVSAETLMLSIKYYLRAQPDIGITNPDLKDMILQQALAYIGMDITDEMSENSSVCRSRTTDGTSSEREYILDLRSTIFGPKDFTRLRYAQLIDSTRGLTTPPDTFIHSVAKDVWTTITRLQLAGKELTEFSRRVFGQISLVAGQTNDVGIEDRECCEICEAVIPLENRSWAKCSNGHQSARCGLSFLAIQAPGISKQCGICKRQYFNDEYVSSQDAAPASTPQQSDSIPAENMDGATRPFGLAQILFASCHVCVYCYGKFVG